MFRSFVLLLVVLMSTGNVWADSRTLIVAPSEKRIALVIGNGSYRDSPLRNPPQDAKLMATTLRGLGFEVIERINADQKAMRRAISEFGQRLEQAGNKGVGLAYYAGHGIQSQGRNFLIPVNADIQGEADLKIEAVEAAEILGAMEIAKSRLNFVVLDACRNNPLARSFRSTARGLVRMDAPEGTLIAYATRPGDVAVDGEGRNSPYTLALSRAIATPGLPVTELFIRVRNEVIAATGKKQVPWEEGGLTAQFYFAGGAGTPMAQSATTPIATSQSSAATAEERQIEEMRWLAAEAQKKARQAHVQSVLAKEKALEAQGRARTARVEGERVGTSPVNWVGFGTTITKTDGRPHGRAGEWRADGSFLGVEINGELLWEGEFAKGSGLIVGYFTSGRNRESWLTTAQGVTYGQSVYNAYLGDTWHSTTTRTGRFEGLYYLSGFGIKADGDTKREGRWINDELDGVGIETTKYSWEATPRRYEGEFRQGQRWGRGMEFEGDGPPTQAGLWQQGKFVVPFAELPTEPVPGQATGR